VVGVDLQAAALAVSLPMRSSRRQTHYAALPRPSLMGRTRARCCIMPWQDRMQISAGTSSSCSGATAMTPSQLDTLRAVTHDVGVQPPDLLVFDPGFTRFSFVEVKGPGDRLRPSQEQSHAAIRAQLGVPVELITVRQINEPPVNQRLERTGGRPARQDQPAVAGGRSSATR